MESLLSTAAKDAPKVAYIFYIGMRQGTSATPLKVHKTLISNIFGAVKR